MNGKGSLLNFGARAEQHVDGRTIQVGICGNYDACKLWIRDEGSGFSLSHGPRKLSSGLGLVQGLTRQLGGEFTVVRDHGAHCVVTFPQTLAGAR